MTELPSADALLELAREAGDAILAVYRSSFDVMEKGDKSPLTAADLASHRIICAGLERLAPGIPVLSEESAAEAYETRAGWRRYWLVDPLDGTREFVGRNGEFTVNIALIEHGRPVFGLVGVPAQDKVYWGVAGLGSWLAKGDEAPRAICVRPAAPASGLTVVQSRSHPSPELTDYLAGIKVAEAVAVGSALKFCIVAEGHADLYPRLGPTMEWDTAAGHAVVAGAGGRVTTLEGEPLQYNKENLLNPYFVVSGF